MQPKLQQQTIHLMQNKDRMTDHQEQQAHEANTDHSKTISYGSVGQTHYD